MLRLVKFLLSYFSRNGNYSQSAANILWELVKEGAGYVVVYRCEYCGVIYYDVAPKIIDDGVPQCVECCAQEYNSGHDAVAQAKECEENNICKDPETFWLNR